MRSYVPIDELGPSERRNWLATLAELPNQPPALAAAILAISLSQLGKSSHDPLLGKESLEHYTSGLKELQRALYDPKQMHTDETLAACLLLSMYELLECPAGNKHAYSIHNRGCARLIQLRGPEAHKTGLAHSLFLAIRPQCVRWILSCRPFADHLQVYQALDHHEQTFLTDPSWLEEPWLQTPKSPLDRLIDYIAVAPGIFGVTDNFSHMEPVETLTTALKIIEYCWKMDEELQDFYLQLDNSIPGPMYWPVLSTTPNVTDDLDREKGKVFPVAFHFFNLGMAAVLTLYWAHLCMMYHGMTLLYYHVMAVIPVDRKQIYSSSRSDIPPLLKAGIPKCSSDCVCKTFDDPSTPCITTFDTSKLIPLGHRNDFLALGRNVCQSAEYCLQKKMLNMGPGTIAAPLSIVLDTIKPYPHAQREFAWGRAVMEGLEERLPYLKWVKK